jgi:uncharacterized protein YkwD
MPRHPIPLLFGLLVAALLLSSCAGSSTPAPAIGALPASSKLQQQIGRTLDRELLALRIIEYVNAYRAQFRIAPIKPDRRVMQTAQWMADYQARNAVVTHTANVPKMTEFGQRYRYHGGPDDSFGAENAGFYSLQSRYFERKQTYDELARHIVSEWIRSPLHQENLLARFEDSPGAAGVGVTLGMYKGAEGVFTTMNVFFR